MLTEQERADAHALITHPSHAASIDVRELARRLLAELDAARAERDAVARELARELARH